MWMGHWGVIMLTPSCLQCGQSVWCTSSLSLLPLTLFSFLPFIQTHVCTYVCVNLNTNVYVISHNKKHGMNRLVKSLQLAWQPPPNKHTYSCTTQARTRLLKEHISQEMQSPKANIAYLYCFRTQHNSHSNYLLWLTSRAYTNSSKRPWQQLQAQRTFHLFVRRMQLLDIIYFLWTEQFNSFPSLVIIYQRVAGCSSCLIQ